MDAIGTEGSELQDMDAALHRNVVTPAEYDVIRMKAFIDGMPLESLVAVCTAIDLRILDVAREEQERVKADAERLAKFYGTTVAAVIGLPEPVPVATPKRKRKSKAVRYVNPDNPLEVWFGKGNQPAWLKTYLANGGKKEELAV